MTGEDQAVALYGMAKKQLEALGVCDAELRRTTAALQVAIAQFEKLPEAVGRQTNQYIAAGIRQAVNSDFKAPIENAIEVPLADFKKAIEEGRSVLQEINRESRFHNWKWVVAMVLFSVLGGIAIDRISITSKLNDMSDRLAVLEQQTAPLAPAPQAKPMDGKTTKGKKGH